ncbi:NADH dehydrogenase I chain J [Salmonella enterica subsp. arizonae]|uniref:NADH-quinone oxidoreductase subunit J n=1 Tax=Salmonella enterica subsp. arizonae TaxID=59203 RepID=A0A379RZP8_SALER|nr:NADH dehydrogenase I chain J [Salmonella enterica subsp. arizonae]
MEFAFYICGLIAILATLRVITHTNPVHALLYLVISLLAISGVFFSLGAYFAGALEIIVYAGAIMVLFVFVVMMLNLGGSEIEQERQWLKPQVWIGPALLSAIMLAVIVYAILGVNDPRYRRYVDQRESGGHYAVRALCSGGRTGVDAAAGRPGGGVPRRS